MNIEDIIQSCDSSFNDTERVNASNNWEELAHVIMPSQSGIFRQEDTPGIKKTLRVQDPFPIQANQDLAAAIHSTLTNPATKWSNLRFKQDQLNNNPETVAWLQEVNRIIHTEFNESNFDTSISKNYQMITGLGTMVLLQDVKYNVGLYDGFNFEAVHLAEISVEENELGQVDTVYRKYKLTGKQLIQKWPQLQNNIEVTEDLKKFHEVIYCVKPNEPKRIKEGQVPAESRPFVSAYVLRKGMMMLEQDGYYEFPYFVTRWQTMPGEKYGRGPGHIGLQGAKRLNKLEELELRSVSQAVNPTWFAEEGNIVSSFAFKPGHLNILRSLDGIREHQSNARFDVAQAKSEDIKNDLRSIFFIDKLFLPPRTETGEMTAFEVDQRLAQMQRVLGPTISRLNSEFLSPLILRTFKVLLREGALPPVPELLKQVGIDIEIGFVNQLSRAQQIEELTSVDGFIRRIAEAAQVKPEALDYINIDEYVKFAAKVLNAPEQIITNDDQVQELRDQRAQQQQAQQALEAGVQVADIQSKTPTEGG